MEAYADAAEPAAVARLALEEALEDALVVTVRDSDAPVFHGYLDLPVPGARPDRDLAAFR